MLRTRNIQAPITEDFVTEFRDCKVFSKLKLNHGHHQFCLDPAAIQTDKWIKTDPDLKPYFDQRAELYMADRLILRIDRIIPPESLRDKIIHIAHKQGHLGISKTKVMLRLKYWFAAMNNRIETVVSTCFDCQIATNTQHTEPATMTKLPERPWETLEIDFCGPLPSKEYALVITDQYPRYPEVEFVYSTAIKPVRQKMKKNLRQPRSYQDRPIRQWTTI